ncbi:MAG: type III pantothenate kinase [Betaproteobacteria bacterium]|nr:type III pantothenate kinase [Betaproteobacteria bacterium]
MDLFIDVGNTKIKWCLTSTGGIEKTGSIFNTELIDLSINSEDIETVFISSVNSENLEKQIVEKIKPLCPHIYFAKVNKQFLETNYSDELGVDRWLGVLALTEKTKKNAIIIDSGTALTIDLLLIENDSFLHKGGLILPGFHLFNQSLMQNSAAIRLKNKDITIDINNSDMALLHGFLMSVSGAVEKFIMHHHLNFNEIDIYLTGGDANIIFDSLEEQLQLKYHRIENAVIEGLKIYKKLALADK